MFVNKNPKLTGFEYHKDILNNAKNILAPMVDQSELAFRMLLRKYGAELCYSPMYHASVFVRDKQYREQALKSCLEDRPLIIQFCANDPDTFLQAALLAQNHCDGIDLNLGCPQAIARRGHYGAFLQEDWNTIHKMVNLCHEKLSVPITCKIRVFEDMEKTLNYVKMLASAGCQVLSVHGRKREQKGSDTGLADWKYVTEIKKLLNIPVFSNGNIQYFDDIERCFNETNVDGVMVAEGSLHNPAIFMGLNPICWEMAFEYLQFADDYKLKNWSYARGHIFKMCHHALAKHMEIRTIVANAKSLEELRNVVEELKQTCLQQCKNKKPNSEILPFPHWICQPYVRPPATLPTDKRKAEDESVYVAENETKISKKKRKKLMKLHGVMSSSPIKMLELSKLYEEKKINSKPKYENCEECGNPRGIHCIYFLCKTCCKIRSKQTTGNCIQHKKVNKRKT